ncbi:hypothetical protein ACI2OX_03695 [Bacillus sp. N9]
MLKEAGVEVNVASESGFTPLMVANHYGNSDIIHLLKEMGRRPNLSLNEKRWLDTGK